MRMSPYRRPGRAKRWSAPPPPVSAPGTPGFGSARASCRSFPRIKLPVLILHGTQDKAAEPSGSQHFFDAVGSQDKTLKLYEGGSTIC